MRNLLHVVREQYPGDIFNQIIEFHSGACHRRSSSFFKRRMPAHKCVRTVTCIIPISCATSSGDCSAITNRLMTSLCLGVSSVRSLPMRILRSDFSNAFVCWHSPLEE